MNIENMNKLIGQLSRLPDEKFYMGDWIIHTDCGTTACIAGWCIILNGDPETQHPKDFTQEFLGLTNTEAAHLFIANGPWGESKRLRDITRLDAIQEMKRCLRSTASCKS